MDLSKAFVHNDQDLPITQPDTYGFGKKLASYNYSYL